MIKRAQIPSTLTWFAGFLVVFFIMFSFIVASSIISGKKTLLFESDSKTIEPDTSPSIVDSQNLMTFLDKEVETQKMREFILSYYDKIIERGLDFNSLQDPDLGLETKLVIIDEAKNKKIYLEIKSFFDVICKDYVVELPQGSVVSFLPDKQVFYSKGELETQYPGKMEERGLSLYPWTELKIPYKGRVVVIKYRGGREC